MPSLDVSPMILAATKVAEDQMREHCIKLATGWAISNGYYPKHDGGIEKTRESIRRALSA